MHECYDEPQERSELELTYRRAAGEVEIETIDFMTLGTSYQSRSRGESKTGATAFVNSRYNAGGKPMGNRKPEQSTLRHNEPAAQEQSQHNENSNLHSVHTSIVVL